MGRKFSLALILELAIALVAFSLVHRSFVTASSNPTNPAEQSYLRLISNSISGKPYKKRLLSRPWVKATTQSRNYL